MAIGTGLKAATAGESVSNTAWTLAFGELKKLEEDAKAFAHTVVNGAKARAEIMSK